jgi:hypothetical protein
MIRLPSGVGCVDAGQALYLTQAQLAQQVGYAEVTLCKIEAGEFCGEVVRASPTQRFACVPKLPRR